MLSLKNKSDSRVMKDLSTEANPRHLSSSLTNSIIAAYSDEYDTSNRTSSASVDESLGGSKKVPPPVPSKNIPAEKLSRLSIVPEHKQIAAKMDENSAKTFVLPAAEVKSTELGGSIHGTNTTVKKPQIIPRQKDEFKKPADKLSLAEKSAETMMEKTVEKNNLNEGSESGNAEARPTPPPRKKKTLVMNDLNLSTSDLTSIPRSSSLDVLTKSSSTELLRTQTSEKSSSPLTPRTPNTPVGSARVLSIISDFEKASTSNSSLSKPQPASRSISTHFAHKEISEKLSKQIFPTGAMNRPHTGLENRPTRSASTSETNLARSLMVTKNLNTSDKQSATSPNSEEDVSTDKSPSSDSGDQVQSQLFAAPLAVPNNSTNSLNVNTSQSRNNAKPIAQMTARNFSPFSKKPKKKSESIKSFNLPTAVDRPRWYEAISDEKEREEFLKNISKEERNRQEVSYEILTTEDDYIKDLQMTIDVYIKPMTEQKLKTKELADIFSNLEQILPVNQVFYTELKKCRNGALMEGVGEAFLKVADYFKLYTMYCGNHSKAVLSIQKQMKSEQTFKNFIKEVQARPDYNGLNLESYLLKPVQRICKYPLLLRELLKSTPEDHKDRKSLEMAKFKIDSIVVIVNERTKQVEVMMKTLEALQRIKGGRELHSPTRKYVLEGPVLLRISAEPEGSQHKNHIFLFNDLLVFTKAPKLLTRDKFILQNIVELSNLYYSDIGDKEGLVNSFIISDPYAAEHFLLSFSSPGEKAKWISELDKCGVVLDATATEQDLLSNFSNVTKSLLSPDSTSKLHSRTKTDGSSNSARESLPEDEDCDQQ